MGSSLLFEAFPFPQGASRLMIWPSLRSNVIGVPFPYRRLPPWACSSSSSGCTMDMSVGFVFSFFWCESRVLRGMRENQDGPPGLDEDQIVVSVDPWRNHLVRLMVGISVCLKPSSAFHTPIPRLDGFASGAHSFLQSFPSSFFDWCAQLFLLRERIQKQGGRHQWCQ